MSAHTCRPKNEDDAILADGCDRCAEHARSPMLLTLDRHKVEALWRRMVEVEKGSGERYYRSKNEGLACSTLYNAATFLERHFGFEARELLARLEARTSP